MSLSIGRLQELLRDNAEFRRKESEREASRRRDSASLQAAVRDVWIRHGVLDPPEESPSSGRRSYHRPLPDSLFQCPLSEPRTALVLSESLPLLVRQRIRQMPSSSAAECPASGSSSVNDEKDSADDRLVEIPRFFLEPGDPATATATAWVADLRGGLEDTSSFSTKTTTTARPIHGNLTNKLGEYTRGLTGGRSRPFRPGGLGRPEQPQTGTIVAVRRGGDSTAKAEHAEAATADAAAAVAVERSKRVLEIGSKAAWEEGGLLLTAPPGAAVDFAVGLSWNDVYGTEGGNDYNDGGYDGDSAVGDELGPPDNEKEENLAHSSRSSETQALPASRAVPAVAIPLFTKAFFDDDSLFGSSTGTSSSDGEGEDDDDDEDEADGEESNKDLAEEVPGTRPRENDAAVASSLARNNAPHEVSLDDDEVDALLIDLSLTDPFHSLSIRRREASGLVAHPLELATRRARDQADASRKSWASTELLPIRDWDALIPNPALVYPFPLDDFQQQAIARLERSESVFVAAHTSAGKTVVAEYAVAMAMQRATRCVYTSPIKALSNQKFRDFCLKFGATNVGLVTGDLQVNVDDSTCLIMTTEILRSMLYRGADLIRDIEYVIFDEVHYVNDTERGVVWEEVIIMLPSYVNLIFLSATTPNTIEFSDWIGRTKRKPVHVVKTDYRPVPLSHHLWAGNKLHKVMEGKGGFSESGYKEAAEALIPQSVKDAIKKGGPKAKPPARPTTGSKQLAWQAQGSKQNWVSLVRFLERELLTPTVVFSFSKKKCVEIAHMLRSLDLNTAKERSAVQSFALQTVARLNPGDSSLPQVLMVCEMVARGIGVHHGGLLPILKEMVEILFSRNLIKVLFATETFAMGVNMPARSVVFNSIRKHDGAQFRVLEPGEYTQMAGRAGRRGLDKVGTVILCCFGEEPPPQQILKQMLTGQSTRLQSQFRLTYNMILNLLRVEDMSVESMISRSFSEFATQRALTAYEYPQLLARGTRSLAKLEDKFEKNSVLRIGAEDLEVYYDVSRRLSAENAEILAYIEQTEASSFSEVLQPGRVCLVTAARELGCVRAPVMVLRSEAGNALLTSGKSREDRTRYVCVVLLPAGFFFAGDSKRGEKGVVGYVGSALRRHYAIREFTLKDILLVSNRKHKIDPKAVLTDKAGRHAQVVSGDGRSVRDDPFVGMKALGRKSLDRNSVADSAGASKIDQKIDEVIQSLLDAEKIELEGVGLPALDLRPFLKRGSEALSYRQRCSNLEELLVQLRSCDSHRHPSIEKFYVELERKDTLREKVEALRHLLSNESLQLFPDFLQRKAVLQKLGYIDANETVCVKGRVACEVNTCEELIATEIVFEGLLNDLQPEEIAAVLSPLVFQGKGGDEEFNVELPMSLIACCRQMKTVARNLGQLQKEQGLTIDPDDYCDSTLNFGLVHVVYEWAMGVPFKSICDLTDVEEGSIVRCITRLDELCREVRNCARVVGNPTLYRKMEAASTAIKRDIVFAASLYVS